MLILAVYCSEMAQGCHIGFSFLAHSLNRDVTLVAVDFIAALGDERDVTQASPVSGTLPRPHTSNKR